MTHARRNTGLLAGPEARALDALLRRLPGWVTPDMLSTVGVIGAAATALGFAIALAMPGWWLLAILGLWLNWFGDGLDGRLARARGERRISRGYLLDNGLDMLSYFLVAAGFALSGLVWPALPFLALALHFALVNLAAARLAVTGVLDLAAGPVGTTELRAVFGLVALVLATLPPELRVAAVAAGWTALDFACWGWIAAMGVTYALTLRADLRATAEQDCQPAGFSMPQPRMAEAARVLEETSR
jgi:archaetidylinositol phosphate synthase